MVLITPLNNLLPRYADQITGGDGKEAALAWISAVGAVAAMVFNPLAGALSDRTTSRLGRRRPWILVGATLTAVLMVVMSYQTSVVTLAALWFLVLAASNVAFSALTAYVPDQAPVNQRGLVSGLVGLAQVVGVVLGVALVSFVVSDLQAGTWLLGGLALVMVLPVVLLVDDAVLPRSSVRAFRWGEFMRGFYVNPREYPDFGWAWITRFLVWLGTAMATIYLLFYLEDFLDYPEPEQGQTMLIGLYGLGTILTAVIGGRMSDKSGKRKIFVVVASVMMGLSVLILAFIPSFPAACVGAFLLGTGYGVYLAVDQALITQVLPDCRGPGARPRGHQHRQHHAPDPRAGDRRAPCHLVRLSVAVPGRIGGDGAGRLPGQVHQVSALISRASVHGASSVDEDRLPSDVGGCASRREDHGAGESASPSCVQPPFARHFPPQVRSCPTVRG